MSRLSGVPVDSRLGTYLDRVRPLVQVAMTESNVSTVVTGSWVDTGSGGVTPNETGETYTVECHGLILAHSVLNVETILEIHGSAIGDVTSTQHGGYWFRNVLALGWTPVPVLTRSGFGPNETYRLKWRVPSGTGYLRGPLTFKVYQETQT